MEEYVSDSESPMVEISGIGKTLGKTVALQDVSLSVRRGELFGFVGPDGAERRAGIGTQRRPVVVDGETQEMLHRLRTC